MSASLFGKVRPIVRAEKVAVKGSNFWRYWLECGHHVDIPAGIGGSAKTRGRRCPECPVNVPKEAL